MPPGQRAPATAAAASAAAPAPAPAPGAPAAPLPARREALASLAARAAGACGAAALATTADREAAARRRRGGGPKGKEPNFGFSFALSSSGPLPGPLLLLLLLLLPFLLGNGGGAEAQVEERGRTPWRVNEASGLAASRRHPGVLWTHNDSGDGPRLFALSAADGSLLGEYRVEGDRVEARDWEDLAVGPGPTPGRHYLYVGDIGDNGARYDSKAIYRVEEPAQRPAGGGSGTLRGAVRHDVRFPGHAGNANSETLLVDPASADVFIVRKTEDHPIQVYRAPAPLRAEGVAPLEEYFLTCVDYDAQCRREAQEAKASGQLVGGDISPSGLGLLIKSYGHMYYWRRSSVQDSFFDSDPRVVPYRGERQGEAVAWAADEKGYFTLSEGSGSELLYYPFLTHHAFVQEAGRAAPPAPPRAEPRAAEFGRSPGPSARSPADRFGTRQFLQDVEAAMATGPGHSAHRRRRPAPERVEGVRFAGSIVATASDCVDFPDPR